jgi:hypothetical protein
MRPATVLPHRRAREECGMLAPAESVLLPLQHLQLVHDRLAHADILSFNLHKRLKHMVLHFFKYAGRMEEARQAKDRELLRSTLVDALIICMASANGLNVSLGQHIEASARIKHLDDLARDIAGKFPGADPFDLAIQQFLLLGGRMAKAVESLDHTEPGDFRKDLDTLVPALAEVTLAVLGMLGPDIEVAVKRRFQKVEAKGIFSRLASI